MRKRSTMGKGGAATRGREYRGFEAARGFVHRLGLNSRTEWMLYVKGFLPGKTPKPADIPYHPDRIYKDMGWTSWGDWLGTDRRASPPV